MLMRSDPFREFDRVAERLLSAAQAGNWSRPASIALDAYRDGDEFVVAFDLPGVSADAIDIDIERNVLTVTAERRPLPVSEQALMQVAERSFGAFSRQVLLSDALDTDNIHATYEDGVLVLRIPVAEQAKPRKISVGGAERRRVIDA